MSTYPINTTGQQFHFDSDGTIGQLISPGRGFNASLSNAELRTLMSWQIGPYTNSANGLYQNFLFPQPRNLVAFSCAHAVTTPALWISYDTTDGMNGIWQQVRTTTEMNKWFYTISTTTLRTTEPFVYNAVRGIEYRAAGQLYLYSLNFFGDYTPIGLRFWHATEDREMDGDNLDFGDIIRSNSYTRQFRIKNFNTLTANNVLVTASSPNAGSTLAGMEFSDGGTYATSQTITSIAPSAISSVITARRTVASNATENQIGNCRITATEGSWS